MTQWYEDHNPFKRRLPPDPWYETPYYPKPNKYPNPFDKPTESRPREQQTRQKEFVELDIGSSVLWCKFCARSKCPCFKEGGKEKTLTLITKLTLKSNGRVIVDILNPDHRWIQSVIMLSHVGCVSFSNVDLQHNNAVIPYIDDPDFLEIG